MQKILNLLFFVLLLGGCGPSMKEKSMLKEADTISNAMVSSSAAVENPKDTTHKFIRTADLKFKVKDVIKSTYHIEDITNQQGGFVTYTNLKSEIQNVTSTQLSADSTLETTYYMVTNTMVLRVSNVKLDTTLKLIAKNIDFLDYRIIKADDVAFQLLSNNLTQNRLNALKKRMANDIDEKGKKLKETVSAEELLMSKQEQADNAKVANLSLNDQIRYSTINISMYQRQMTKPELVVNEKNQAAYEPGFGSKIGDALKTGWEIVEGFILFVTRIWGVILVVLLAFIAYRWGSKRLKK